MDKQLKTVWQFIKANPVTMACLAVAVIITVSTIAYSHSHSTSLQRKQVESEAKLAQAIDNSKKVKSEREKSEEEAKKKAEEAKAAEELKLLEEKKAAEQAAAVAAAEAAKKKTTTSTTDKKKTEEKTYESVSVSLSRSGSVLSASIGSAKAGTCYFTFKEYVGGEKKNYTEGSVSAANGTCSISIPAGTWTNAYVTYKASDYSAKGYADIAL